MANVKFINTEYVAKADNWNKTRLACSANGIKDAGVTFLPMALDKDADKYKSYKQRALFLGVTGRTRAALVGAAFRIDPTFSEDLPTQMEFVTNDFDGSGVSIDQVAKRMVSEIQTVGRNGLLVDFPLVPVGASREDELKLGVHPFAASYAAESIINWEETKVNGKTQLSMVVLRESTQEARQDDEFEKELVTRYRSLQLIDGLYVVRLWNSDGELMGEPSEPKIRGQRLNYIPFYFTGSEDNKASVDEIPLEPIAEINVGHYRNSADFEKNLHIYSGGTMVVMSSMDSAEWNEVNPNGVVVGADSGIKLMQGDDAKLLQLEPAGAVNEAMIRKEEQMISIGARMITSGNINETAEAARISASSETSTLSTIVGNTEETLNRALAVMAEAVGVDAPIYNMNRDFFDSKLTAQEFMAINVMYDAGHIAGSDVKNVLRKSGIVGAERTDKDIDDENASASPV